MAARRAALIGLSTAMAIACGSGSSRDKSNPDTAGAAGAEVASGSGAAGTETGGGAGTRGATGGGAGEGAATGGEAGATGTGGVGGEGAATGGEAGATGTGGVGGEGAATGGAAGEGGATGGEGGATGSGGVGGEGATTGGAGGEGPSSGGVAGEGPATGGDGGGTSSGGDAGAGGSAGSGGVVINPFRAGPCVVSPDGADIEVLARGADRNIYRRQFSGDTPSWTDWAELAGLSDSLLDVGSDLDCAANALGVHIVARGNNPAGSLQHAYGSGTLYNEFVRELEPSVFISGVSVTGRRINGTGYALVAQEYSLLRLAVYAGGAPDEYTALDEDIDSDLDMVPTYGTMDTYYYIAGFAGGGTQLVIKAYYSAYSGTGWTDPVIIPTHPSGGAYEYSPAICARVPATGNTQGGLHAIVVVNSRLWYASLGRPPTDAVEWQEIAPDVVIESAPDCAVLSSGVHAVARTATGTVVHVEVPGGSGATVVTDLGGY